MTRCVAWIAGVVCIGALTGCSGKPEKSGKFLERGKEYAEKKDYPRAVLQFRNEAKLLPKSPEPYYQLGLAYLAMHDAQAAYAHFRKAVDLDPNHRDAQIKIAEMLAMNKDKDIRKQAEDRAKEVLQHSPGNPDALTVLGVSLIASGDYKAGEEQLRAALQSAPTHLKSALFLASLKSKENDFAGAEKVLKSVVEKDPSSADAALALGQFYSAAKRRDDAMSEYERAVKLQPNRGVALLLLSQMQFAAGRVTDGEQTVRRLSALPDKQYRTAHARYLLESKQIDAGIAELKQIFDKDPSDRNTRVLLTQIYMAINRESEAEKLIESALKANRKDTEALLQRSDIFLARGKYAAAQKDVSEVLRLIPDSSDAHWIQARLHKRQGSHLQSRQELVETIRLNPNLLNARLELVDVDLSSGANSTALEWLDKVPAAQRASLPVVTKRIKILLAMTRYVDARTGLNEALKRTRSRDLLMLDAQLRLIQKDFAGARAAAEEILNAFPEDVAALEYVASSYTGQHNPEAALKRIQDQVARRPASARLQYFLALQLAANRKKSESRAALQAALNADRSFFPATIELAKDDISEGRSEQARQALTPLLASKVTEKAALMLLAQIEIRTSNNAVAIEHYRRILGDDPSNIVALNNVASLLADQPAGADEALKYAQQLKELRPNDALVDDTLGWALYRKGLYTSAIQHLQAASEKESNPVVKYHLAMAYFKVGDVKNAQKTLEIALKLNPAMPEAVAARQLIAQR